jgi:hypothetical protein
VPDENPFQSPEAAAIPAAPATGVLTADDKLWAMLANLSALAGYVVGFGQYIAPLVIYLVYKDKSKFVAFHALQTLYFQLGLLVIVLVISGDVRLRRLCCGSHRCHPGTHLPDHRGSPRERGRMVRVSIRWPVRAADDRYLSELRFSADAFRFQILRGPCRHAA